MKSLWDLWRAGLTVAVCTVLVYGVRIYAKQSQSRKRGGSSGTLEDLHFLARGFESDLDNKLSLSEHKFTWKEKSQIYDKQDDLWKGYWDVFALPNFIFTLKYKWHSKFTFFITLLFLFAVRSICILSLCDWHVCARGFLSRYFPISLNSVLIFFCFPESFCSFMY